MGIARGHMARGGGPQSLPYSFPSAPALGRGSRCPRALSEIPARRRLRLVRAGGAVSRGGAQSPEPDGVALVFWTPPLGPGPQPPAPSPQLQPAAARRLSWQPTPSTMETRSCFSALEMCGPKEAAAWRRGRGSWRLSVCGGTVPEEACSLPPATQRSPASSKPVKDTSPGSPAHSPAGTSRVCAPGNGATTVSPSSSRALPGMSAD